MLTAGACRNDPSPTCPNLSPATMHLAFPTHLPLEHVFVNSILLKLVSVSFVQGMFVVAVTDTSLPKINLMAHDTHGNGRVRSRKPLRLPGCSVEVPICNLFILLGDIGKHT